MHEFCRSPEEIFRARVVFNTGVENFVQKRSRDRVNPPFFNGLMRFAQNLCKETAAQEILVTNEHRFAAKRFVWRMREEKYFAEISPLLAELLVKTGR